MSMFPDNCIPYTCGGKGCLEAHCDVVAIMADLSSLGLGLNLLDTNLESLDSPLDARRITLYGASYLLDVRALIAGYLSRSYIFDNMLQEFKDGDVEFIAIKVYLQVCTVFRNKLYLPW